MMTRMRRRARKWNGERRWRWWGWSAAVFYGRLVTFGGGLSQFDAYSEDIIFNIIEPVE
jgi:hypothetical protein